MSKYQKLNDAGLVPAGTKLTDDQKKAIEGLSETDVKALISAGKKLSKASEGQKSNPLGISVLPKPKDPKPPK
jgi:hypothetical protein